MEDRAGIKPTSPRFSDECFVIKLSTHKGSNLLNDYVIGTSGGSRTHMSLDAAT